MRVFGKYKQRQGGLRLLVELLEYLPRAQQERMLARAEEEDPKYLHQDVLPYLICFEDLAHLPSETLRQVLKVIPLSILADALLVAPEALKQQVLTELTEKEKDLVQKRWLEGNLTGSEQRMERCQREVVLKMRQLEKSGVLLLKSIPKTKKTS